MLLSKYIKKKVFFWVCLTAAVVFWGGIAMLDLEMVPPLDPEFVPQPLLPLPVVDHPVKQKSYFTFDPAD